MSLHVLKRKMLNKERHRAMNSAGGGYNIAVTNTGVNKSKCTGAHNKTPIIQQSYHNLYRTRIKHYVDPKTTWKRMPESSTKQYIDNIKSSAINANDNSFINLPLNTTLITTNSIVNIINSSGNKYVFNNSSSYDSNQKWALTNGTYIFKNIPPSHPIAILNNNNSNISYSLVNDVNSPIIIKVSGGNTAVGGSGDYYTFTDKDDNPINIGSGAFKFMRGKTYKFQANNIDTNHPFKIFMSGSFVNSTGITGTTDSITITIPTTHSTTSGDLYYQCGVHDEMKKNLSLFFTTLTGTTADGSYDFYYGDVAVTVSGNFDKISLYCFYHGYMGGENLLVYVETKNSPKMLNAGDQIARVKARRVCKCTDYELEITGGSASKSVCP
tara:strand:+ start:595 stop:1743 length:1149 start_codon:yes stop_codon:yes gene_type:complete